jgi:hypothetical protein
VRRVARAAAQSTTTITRIIIVISPSLRERPQLPRHTIPLKYSSSNVLLELHLWRPRLVDGALIGIEGRHGIALLRPFIVRLCAHEVETRPAGHAAHSTRRLECARLEVESEAVLGRAVFIGDQEVSTLRVDRE